MKSDSPTHSAGYISDVEIQGLISQANSEDNSNNVTISQYEDEGDILVRIPEEKRSFRGN
jgi:hypothetical protein